MTWAQLLDYYLTGCSRTEAAQAEAYIHLSEAYRIMCGTVDCAEVFKDDLRFTCVASQDYVASAQVSAGTFTEMWDLYSGFNLTAAHAIYEEPEGMRGRDQYLTTTGKPSEGTVQYYTRMAAKIYLRDTPNSAQVLMFRTRLRPAAITAADVAASPVLPEQYHVRIAQEAMLSYFMLHPEDPVEGRASRAAELAAGIDRLAAREADPKREEKANMRNVMRVGGYNLGRR